jgi:hypothetical protein
MRQSKITNYPATMQAEPLIMGTTTTIPAKELAFIKSIHGVYTSYSLDMDDFMEALWALMLKKGITWKSEVELSHIDLKEASNQGLEVDSYFETLICSDRSIPLQEFTAACDRTMNFTGMFQESPEFMLSVYERITL